MELGAWYKLCLPSQPTLLTPCKLNKAPLSTLQTLGDPRTWKGMGTHNFCGLQLHLKNIRVTWEVSICPSKSVIFTALMKMFSTFLSVGNSMITKAALLLFLDKSRGAWLPSSSYLKERPSIQGLTIISLHSSEASVWPPSVETGWANSSGISSS